MVCGEPKVEGMTIVTQFICTSCENEMVRTEVEEEKYSFFVRRMRQLWVKFHA
ncbi:sigma factor G inhibitor Gin [Cohnella suwonensis]|uniref:Sigma factor G inhibitor Gin n=1 Tax=Cohnella suwonensis TaxID=696072 RepID=A0ABW0LX79_9BACL